MSVREGGKGSEVAGWAGGKEMGRRMKVFWAVERKENGRGRKGAGPAGLKVEEGKRKAFHFLKDSNTFNSNSNSRIQIQTEQQTIKLCKDSMNA